MKETFKGFYNPTDEDLKSIWSSNETIFIFDTNVLLNLYSYAENTKNDFFNLINKLSDKIWIPYYAGLEYQRRRLETIGNEKKIFTKINTNLEKIKSIMENDFNELSLKKRMPILFDKTKRLEKEIKLAITKYNRTVKKLDNEQPCVRSHDEIREKIDTVFNNKIGTKPVSQDWLNGIYTEGKKRYELKVPPGFMDASKSKGETPKFMYEELIYERQFGDLIIWKQILEYTQKDKIKNVIFVTDDAKQDWWYILESRGKKQIGPHSYLISEIMNTSNIDNFQMYKTADFLDIGNEFFSLDINASSIKEAQLLFDECRMFDSSIEDNFDNNSIVIQNVRMFKENIEGVVSQIFGCYMYLNKNLTIIQITSIFNIILETLPEYEKKIFKYKYTLIDRPRSDSSVANHFNVSEKKIEQTINKTFMLLRHPRRSKILLEYFDRSINEDLSE